jgi:hypothetical protein
VSAGATMRGSGTVRVGLGLGSAALCSSARYDDPCETKPIWSRLQCARQGIGRHGPLAGRRTSGGMGMLRRNASRRYYKRGSGPKRTQFSGGRRRVPEAKSAKRSQTWRDWGMWVKTVLAWGVARPGSETCKTNPISGSGGRSGAEVPTKRGRTLLETRGWKCYNCLQLDRAARSDNHRFGMMARGTPREGILMGDAGEGSL